MKTRVSVRLSPDVLDAVDKWRRHHADTTGVSVTRTGAIEALIRRAIGGRIRVMRGSRGA